MKTGNIAEKNRFLRRALTFNNGTEVVLKKIRLKKRYISQIQEKEPGEDPIYDLRKHRYFKKKTLYCLKHVQLSSLRNLDWFNELKNAQNLKTIKMCIGKEDFDKVTGFQDTNAKIEHVLQCMKKFPKKISSTNLYIEGFNVKKGHLKLIYRIISSFRVEILSEVIWLPEGGELR